MAAPFYSPDGLFIWCAEARQWLSNPNSRVTTPDNSYQQQNGTTPPPFTPQANDVPVQSQQLPRPTTPTPQANAFPIQSQQSPYIAPQQPQSPYEAPQPTQQYQHQYQQQLANLLEPGHHFQLHISQETRNTAKKVALHVAQTFEKVIVEKVVDDVSEDVVDHWRHRDGQ